MFLPLMAFTQRVLKNITKCCDNKQHLLPIVNYDTNLTDINVREF